MFFEKTYETYCKRRNDFGLESGTIDAYLDAKSEEDFLETRGAKLGVCLEKLKSVFIKNHKAGKSEFIVPETIFNPLVSDIRVEIKRLLSAVGINSKDSNSITGAGKIRFLNRKPFEVYISKLIDEIKLKVNSRDVTLFVRCRNKLVHEGEFYAVAATPDERIDCPPLPDPKEEYYFMLDFLDRIFLKLVGYEGPYMSCRQIPTSGIHKDLLS